MERLVFPYLHDWIKKPSRKPLVIRGARQVGKTWLVRHLAETTGRKLIELNFEKRPADFTLFESNDVKQILLNLSTITNTEINPQQALLFLDEVQVAPQILSKLRWFAEDMPELPVVAAGSLLEFVLSEHSFSMPVGRITYIHVEPLSFEEFLLANKKSSLLNYLRQYDLNNVIPSAIHEELNKLFKEYLIVGGLPASVLSWIEEHSLTKVEQIQYDLLATYRDDFAKYKGRLSLERLEEVMSSIPRMLGQKFVFSHVNKAIQAATIKQVLDLLEKARLCSQVVSSAANGVPLGAEVKEKYFKEIFLDVGLCSIALGLSLTQINQAEDITLINQGGIAEQVVGQLLRTITPPYKEPALYCWHRDQADSNAEIDYVIQQGERIIPIEVKAGSTGSLKSLHLFMGMKKLPLALRINADLPTKTNINVKDFKGDVVNYELISLPFYLIGQLHRLVETTK